MGISQDKTSSRLWLLVFFLLGVAVTFVVLRLGDVGFQRPMNPGPWSPPYPDPRPPPSDTPRPEPVTFHPVATTPPRPASTAPVTKPPRRVVDMRLPRDIWPKHYNLSLKVFLPGYGVSIPPEQQYEFIGQVILTFENEKPLKRIVLNQRNLGVIQYSLTTETGDTIPITKVVTQDNFEFVIFELAKYLQPGTHQLYVEYKGNMKNNKEAGLYLSRDSPSRENRFVAMTDMEPFDARAMMTCLDEPEYKSVWKVFVTHPKESMALANEIDEYVRKMGDWKMTSFEETPIMSSYLVAIFVGNYSYVEDYTARGLRVRVYAPPELAHQTKWSLEVAVKAMDTYEKLFDIPYPMKKLDQLFSTDFSSGAMENWGLVTYRPEALLYLDDGDYDQKLNVALVVAHELGHQWFGNLVTTAWWSQLWLNEGWATFLEFIGTEKAYNSTISEFRYYLATIREAMKADYMYGRPMTYEVTYQEEIKGAMFDDVTYQKGAALITMLKELLGTQIFDEAVRNYLKKYQYKSTNQQDLFGEFDAVIPEDKLGPDGKRLNVTHFGLQYTMQKGIPMVSLAPHNTTHSRLSQRMITNKTNKNPRYDYSPYGFKWDVPIYVQRGEDGREFYWMSAGRDLFIPSSASETLIVNADSYVYSLVNYTESQWIAIARSLKKNHTMFSEQARTKLIHDMHAFGLYKKLYQLLDEYPFKSENDYLPFATFLKSSREMEDTYGPQLKDSMAKYMKTGLEARVKTMDIRETVRRIVDAKTYNQERLSLLLYIEYCRLAPAECQNDLSEMFKDDFLSKCKEDQMASKCSAVLPELRQLVYCAGVQSRGDEVTKMLIKMRSVEQWAAESERLLIAGLCSHDKKFVWKSLASIGVEAPSKTSSLLVDNGLGSRIVADYTIDNLLEEKPIYERRAPSRHGVSRKFRQFGRNEAMEKMRKAISKAVDRAQKMREDVDVGRGRQLAEELDRKTRQLAFL